MSDDTLALATANANSRIRRDGLSAREVWTQRDQLTGEQLPIVDRQLILSQNYSCQQNHAPSAKSKARGRTNLPSAVVSVGDLVFLKGDRDKELPPVPAAIVPPPCTPVSSPDRSVISHRPTSLHFSILSGPLGSCRCST